MKRITHAAILSETASKNNRSYGGFIKIFSETTSKNNQLDGGFVKNLPEIASKNSRSAGDLIKTSGNPPFLNGASIDGREKS